MIKLSWFIVVQAALIADVDAISCNAHQEVLEGRYIELVTKIIDKFIVRGTNRLI